MVDFSFPFAFHVVFGKQEKALVTGSFSSSVFPLLILPPITASNGAAPAPTMHAPLLHPVLHNWGLQP